MTGDPLIQVDGAAKSIVLEYNLPEPTTYRGRFVVELDLPQAVFAANSPFNSQQVVAVANDLVKAQNDLQTAIKARKTDDIVTSAANLKKAQISLRVAAGEASGGTSQDLPVAATHAGLASPPGGNMLSDQTASADPAGSPRRYNRAPSTNYAGQTETIAGDAVAQAFRGAKATGVFDPSYFPNIAKGGDRYTISNVKEALTGLDEDTVVSQFRSGNRLTIYRTSTGSWTYRFLQEPKGRRPRLLITHDYSLTSFLGRYGAGRVLKTFSLLPGERTKIRINTYMRNKETKQRASSIIDSVSDETEADFQRTALSESTSQADHSNVFEYHADVEAEGKAEWGWGSASVTASGGVAGDMKKASQEFAKSISNAVKHNVARASARRDVHIDTSMEAERESGEEYSVEREIENINAAQTLNFVFCQMNQEYYTVLHLTDVRVAYFDGYRESRHEVPLHQIDSLISSTVLPDSASTVRDMIESVLGDLHFVSIGQGTEPRSISWAEGASSGVLLPNGQTVHVPGQVVGQVDTHVMRTDGVIVDTFLGKGYGLDEYSEQLREQDIRTSRVHNDMKEAEVETLKLANKIVAEGNEAQARLFQMLYPMMRGMRQRVTETEFKLQDGKPLDGIPMADAPEKFRSL